MPLPGITLSRFSIPLGNIFFILHILYWYYNSNHFVAGYPVLVGKNWKVFL